MFDWGFNANKLKPQLKMAVHRFQMASNKKSALLKQNMREVAVLLAEDPPKEEKARIKAEALIRDDYVIEAYDILSLNCELLSERIKLIQFSKECPPDLISCISTLMYAAPRVDIPELLVIRKQFSAKYGKKFDEEAMGNVGGILNERVVTKLSVQPPAAYLVQTYLEQICEKYEVDWSPNYRLSAEQMGEPMAPPSGFSVPIGQGTGLGHVAHTGMTVSGEDDITYDGGQSLPPPKAPNGDNSNGSEPRTQSEFYIPSAPGGLNTPPIVPPSVHGTETPNEDISKNDDDDNYGDQINANSPGQPLSSGGKDSASYNDLAARFENLRNL
jgi:vacuolar protein sorting-associated protein IST1